MPEIINENILKDETEALEKKPSVDFEFSKTSETEELAKSVNAIIDAIDHDGVVKISDFEKIEKSLGGIKVDVDGEQFTFEEFKSIPDIKENIKIWKEVMDGKFNNTDKLTLITSRIAEYLSAYQGSLDLGRITIISDKIAEHLSRHQGELFLDGLTTISDITAEHFSKHQGDVYLFSLTSISDASAEYLSRHQGDLRLYGLTTISDTTAEHLSKHKGDLYLYSLTTISDTAAKHLSKHQGYLSLKGLTTISDTAAEHLSKHAKLYVEKNIREIIEKFKQ